MNPELSTKLGIANIGNTCFFNSALQCLRLCPAIGEIFLKPDALRIRDGSDRKELVQAFRTLMIDFWKNAYPIDSSPTLIPKGFFQSLFNVLEETNNGWYSKGEQADAPEAIQYILESLHDGMYHKVNMEIQGSATNCEETSQIKAIESWAKFYEKEYSPIIDKFHGQTQICVKCERCGAITERYEPWMMIKVPIPGGDEEGGPAPNLTSCLSAAFAPDSLDDFDCNSCARKLAKANGEYYTNDDAVMHSKYKTKGKATIYNRISRLPPVVILSIKRFTNDGRKVRGKLDWDLDGLDISPVMAFSRNPFASESVKKSSIYETYAVIEHHGSLHGGHYTMYGKQNESWYEYDDNSVNEVTPDRVVNQDSYILFLIPKSSSKQMNATFAETIRELRNRSQ